MTNLATLTKELTLDELHELREEIATLEEALKNVPEEFDFSFQEKIHRVLDITNELTDHTKQLRDTIEHSQLSFQKGLIETAIYEQNKRLDKHQVKIENLLYGCVLTDKLSLILFVAFVAILIGAAIGSAFYILAFVL
ncbi:hypothetical protein JCM19239_1504 [Vibrio variabilis]|uniref:Uncharacterized protein n=1 Tax=Vibrio variabilis TaxID=990271 RepID=A0ABQ0JGD7_9VIBR|nr:hypothetical protein JCM19239_1504 [Vibrio variabilis]